MGWVTAAALYALTAAPLPAVCDLYSTASEPFEVDFAEPLNDDTGYQYLTAFGHVRLSSRKFVVKEAYEADKLASDQRVAAEGQCKKGEVLLLRRNADAVLLKRMPKWLSMEAKAGLLALRAPGARVTLDDTPLRMDAKGRAEWPVDQHRLLAQADLTRVHIDKPTLPPMAPLKLVAEKSGESVSIDVGFDTQDAFNEMVGRLIDGPRSFDWASELAPQPPHPVLFVKCRGAPCTLDTATLAPRSLKRLADVQLIAVRIVLSKEYQRCKYAGLTGILIQRIKHVDVFNARTGSLIATHETKGSAWDGCPESLSLLPSDTEQRLYGSEPPDDDIDEWLSKL
jgi:hypothetical protein